MQLVMRRARQQHHHIGFSAAFAKGLGAVGVLTLVGLLALLFLGSGCTVPDTAYCSVDEDCLRNALDGTSPQTCHPTHHICISTESACADDNGCRSAAAPHCNSKSLHCEACAIGESGNQACSHFGTKPFCGQDGRGGTTCVECLANLDCPAGAPICDGQRCRKCTRHSDCEGSLRCEDGNVCSDSLVCIGDADFGKELGGRCAKNGDAPSGRVVYVHDDGSGGCKDTGNTGTAIEHPFCSIDAAYNEASARMRTYVRVLAGRDYMPLANPLRSGKVVLIGAPVPSRGITAKATLDQVGQPLYVLETADVTVDEFELYQSMGNARAIQCLATLPGYVPRFTLRNSVVRGSTSAGGPHTMPAIDLDSCQAIIAGNFIGVTQLRELSDMGTPAHSLGLRIANDPAFAGSSFIVENNVIAGNWDVGVDLYRVASAGVTFRFNTVIGNGRRGVSGGIHCPSFTPVSINYSIISGNAAGPQFQDAAQCRFKQVVVGQKETSMAAGLIHSDARLGDSFELLPGPENTASCIDKAQPTMDEVFPAFDLRRAPRPQGQGWDLGAYELMSGM